MDLFNFSNLVPVNSNYYQSTAKESYQSSKINTSHDNQIKTCRSQWKMSFTPFQYSTNKFQPQHLKDMDRIELFQILFQVQQKNTNLKQKNQLQMTTLANICKINKTQSTVHINSIIESQKKSQIKSQNEYSLEKQFQIQFTKLLKKVNKFNEQKKIQKKTQQYKKKVQNLQSQIQNHQQTLQSIQQTLQQFQSTLKQLETLIQKSHKKIAQQQVIQKYKNLNHYFQTDNLQLSSLNYSNNQNFQSEQQIDQLMNELYLKIKNLIRQNDPELQ